VSRENSPLRDKVIFMVGARRSGTNWLQRIVAGHPDVACAPTETYLFSRGIALLAERFQHGAAGSYTLAKIYMDRDAFLDAVRDFCDQVFTGLIEVLGPGASRFAERTPEHSQHLDLIGDVYPDARIAHIIRDGRDVARSLVSQGWGPQSLRDAASEWDLSVRKAREAGRHLEHYYEVRYEELLADPATQVPRLYRALDLEADDTLVRRILVEADVPYNVDRNFPTVAAGKWRETFSDGDVAIFEEVAGDLLDELGYERAAPAPATPSAAPIASPRDRPQAPALIARARRLAGRALGRSARVPNAATDPLALGEIQLVVDRFLEAASSRKADALRELLQDAALCRVVSADDDWSERGEEARERLIAALLGDPAFGGRQVRGDVHPAYPQYTFFGVWVAGGETYERMLLLTATAGKVTRLTWYQLPLRAGAS
jgi:hypothetical protein